MKRKVKKDLSRRMTEMKKKKKEKEMMIRDAQKERYLCSSCLSKKKLFRRLCLWTLLASIRLFEDDLCCRGVSQ